MCAIYTEDIIKNKIFNSKSQLYQADTFDGSRIKKIINTKFNSIDVYQKRLYHWCAELSAHLENLEGIKLKAGNKKKITDYALITAEDLNTNIQNIINKIKYKFRDEGIVKKNEIYKVAELFQNELPILSEIISNVSDKDVADYIEITFNN